jgi:hypothetical protein
MRAWFFAFNSIAPVTDPGRARLLGTELTAAASAAIKTEITAKLVQTLIPSFLAQFNQIISHKRPKSKQIMLPFVNVWERRGSLPKKPNNTKCRYCFRLCQFASESVWNFTHLLHGKALLRRGEKLSCFSWQKSCESGIVCGMLIRFFYG